MATVAVYNGFGKYEINDAGENGITLTYAGVPFWLPYKRVTYLPDFTFREVNHRESSAEQGEEGVLTYLSYRVSGDRLAEELLDKQEPVPNKNKGIIRLDKAKRKEGNPISVYAGITQDGTIVTAEVYEVVVSETDAAFAERTAREYKEQVIQEYFASKRERMAGGKGQLTAKGFQKIFMRELGVKDIDALPTPGNGNLEQLFTQFMATVTAGKPAPIEPAKNIKPARAVANPAAEAGADLV